MSSIRNNAIYKRLLENAIAKWNENKNETTKEILGKHTNFEMRNYQKNECDWLLSNFLDAISGFNGNFNKKFLFIPRKNTKFVHKKIECKNQMTHLGQMKIIASVYQSKLDCFKNWLVWNLLVFAWDLKAIRCFRSAS